MQQFQANPFKARQLNQSVMSSNGNLGVPKISKKPLSDPMSPELSTKKRAELNKPHQTDDKELRKTCVKITTNVHNSTLNSTFQRFHFFMRRFGVTDSDCSEQLTTSVNRSFTLNTSVRASSRQKFDNHVSDKENAATSVNFVAQPIPVTTYKPQKLVKVQIEARLLPPYDDCHLCGNIAVQSSKQVTQPEPFQLESVERHEAAKADLKQKMKNDNVQEVRARPSLSLPFITHKANTLNFFLSFWDFAGKNASIYGESYPSLPFY